MLSILIINKKTFFYLRKVRFNIYLIFISTSIDILYLTKLFSSFEEEMQNSNEKILEFTFLKNQKSQQPIRIGRKNHHKKQYEPINLKAERNNEWQQEYFIIYNSYVLEK